MADIYNSALNVILSIMPCYLPHQGDLRVHSLPTAAT